MEELKWLFIGYLLFGFHSWYYLAKTHRKKYPNKIYKIDFWMIIFCFLNPFGGYLATFAVYEED